MIFGSIDRQYRNGLPSEINTLSTGSIHGIFERQVQKTPDRIALVHGDQEITYRELNQRANRLAAYLLSLGLGREALVGLMLERSPDLVVAILGILKAGCAYVPLDPEYPQERLSMLIEDAAPPLVLTRTSSVERWSGKASSLISIDEIDLSGFSDENPGIESDRNDLAYVMFTSGSTGRPKGVMIEHRSVVRLVRDTNYADFSDENVFLLLAPITFDASTFEIWGALLNGARLAIMPAGVTSLTDLGKTIRRHNVTTLWLTAGLFHLMVDERIDDLRPLRQLLAGGDVLSPTHVRKVVDQVGCDVINGYGPTENTTFTCCYTVTRETDLNRSIPIGKPIGYTSVHILDENMLPVQNGESGEIYAGGDGVARGYLNQDALTAEKFVFSQHPELASTRLYRTGDMGRMLPEGNIEFLGRADNQIKIRGFRVELEEIESALMAHPTVRQAVAVAREVATGDKQLVAFVVANDGQVADTCGMRTQLESVLPEHMIPAFILPIGEMPLTPNGKVDRQALIAGLSGVSNRTSEFVAPEMGIERLIASQLEDILTGGPFGADDNFFDLGANSLQLASLHSRLQSALGRELRITSLFQSPTIRTLARTLEDTDSLNSSTLISQERGARQRAAFGRKRRVQIGGIGS